MATDDALREALSRGELEVEGRLLDASNAAFLCSVDGVACVYKPVSGERELWDFPQHSLSLREVATYELSVRCSMPLIPVTVWREDGPAGPGMCQEWIEHVDVPVPIDVLPAGESPDGWLVVMRGQAPDGATVELSHEDSAFLRDAAFLDAVANNADRKGGHVLAGPDGRLWLIDHGVTFNVDDKLRTVLWGFAGEELRPHHREALASLSDLSFLERYLSRAEIRATAERIERLREENVLPFPGSEWPPLPWPLF